MPVREVDIAEYFDAALPLMREHWRETGFGFEFNPSRELYERGQAGGYIFALGAFICEELVGYASAICAPHPFNPAVIVASTDTLYVVPQYRGTVLPGRLMHAVREAARTRGARFVLWHTRAGTPLASVLEAHGCEMADTVMMEEL